MTCIYCEQPGSDMIVTLLGRKKTAHSWCHKSRGQQTMALLRAIGDRMPKIKTDEQYISDAQGKAKDWADKLVPPVHESALPPDVHAARIKLHDMIEQLYMMAWGAGRMDAWEQARAAVEETPK